MPFRIIRNDIAKVSADVIVNTADPHPVVGRGTDSAVYKAAGKKALLAERRKIGNIAPGQAAATPAFALSAKYIIHTVGPVWNGGDHCERDILRSCYKKSLDLACELNAESIAFPLIAAGNNRFPKDEALNIALEEIGRFLLLHDMEIILVVFDENSFMLSKNLTEKIEEYIDEHSVGIASRSEYENIRETRRSLKETLFNSIQRTASAAGKSVLNKIPSAEAERICADALTCEEDAAPAAVSLMNVEGKSLDEVLENTGETFRQRLFRLIDESGMDDVTVYKKANIDRKVFSRIRCKEDYIPKKRTAVAFAIALRLDMPTMLDLLSRAEIAFSPSSKFDLIITYFVTNGIYDIFEINAALFKYGQPILGE